MAGPISTRLPPTSRRAREVDSYDLLGFENGTIAGKNIAMVIASSEAEPVDLPIVQGRAPRVAGEAAIGTVTADRLGLEIGDVATVDFREGQTPLKIVGTTVLPAVGQLFSDRSGLGVGAFALVPPEVMNGEIVTFVGVNLKDGADAPAVLADLEPRLIAWDTTHSVPNSYAGPIRPSEIVNAEEMQRGPLILAALLGLASIAALAISIAATVGAHAAAILRSIAPSASPVGRWRAACVGRRSPPSPSGSPSGYRPGCSSAAGPGSGSPVTSAWGPR